MADWTPPTTDLVAWHHLRVEVPWTWEVTAYAIEVVSVNIGEDVSITYRLDGEETTEVVLPAEEKKPLIKKLAPKEK